MIRRLGFLVPLVLGCLLLSAGCAAPGAGERGDADRFERGKQAYLSERYSEAFELLVREAEDGNAEAQYTVGYMYYQGQGVNKNDELALRWIRESAAGGNSRAVEALGQMAGMGARQRAVVPDANRAPLDDEMTSPDPAKRPGLAGRFEGSPGRATPDLEDSQQPPDPTPARPRTEPPTPSAAREGTREVSGGFSVQVGSFRSRDNAAALRDHLRANDFQTSLTETDQGSGLMYRILVGPVQSRAQARDLQRQIEERIGSTSIIIVPQGQ